MNLYEVWVEGRGISANQQRVWFQIKNKPPEGLLTCFDCEKVLKGVSSKFVRDDIFSKGRSLLVPFLIVTVPEGPLNATLIFNTESESSQILRNGDDHFGHSPPIILQPSTVKSF